MDLQGLEEDPDFWNVNIDEEEEQDDKNGSDVSGAEQAGDTGVLNVHMNLL